VLGEGDPLTVWKRDRLGRSLRDLIGQTGLPANQFPDLCPWAFEQVMNSEFWLAPLLLK
jgi:hypothetical protein